jgi:hypothetical protein
MNERYDYMKLEAIVRTARMERSIALGNAIGGMAGKLAAAISRGVAAVRAVASRRAGPDDAASAHR